MSHNDLPWPSRQFVAWRGIELTWYGWGVWVFGAEAGIRDRAIDLELLIGPLELSYNQSFEWTALEAVNRLVLQWFFVRLARVLDDHGRQVGWRLLRWVVPTTGWSNDFVFLRRRRSGGA